MENHKDERLDSCSGGLNRGEGSVNSSSDVDGIDGRVPNRENGLKSEDETGEVGEAQEGSEEEVGQFVGNIDEFQPERVRGRLRTGTSKWMMGKLTCREMDVILSKNVVVESEAKVRPTLRIASSSHLKCLWVQNHLKLHASSTHSLFPPLSIAKPMNWVVHVSLPCGV